jgi:hypothetical protein
MNRVCKYLIVAAYDLEKLCQHKHGLMHGILTGRVRVREEKGRFYISISFLGHPLMLFYFSRYSRT